MAEVIDRCMGYEKKALTRRCICTTVRLLLMDMRRGQRVRDEEELRSLAGRYNVFKRMLVETFGEYRDPIKYTV